MKKGKTLSVRRNIRRKVTLHWRSKATLSMTFLTLVLNQSFGHVEAYLAYGYCVLPVLAPLQQVNHFQVQLLLSLPLFLTGISTVYACRDIWRPLFIVLGHSMEIGPWHANIYRRTLDLRQARRKLSGSKAMVISR